MFGHVAKFCRAILLTLSFGHNVAILAPKCQFQDVDDALSGHDALNTIYGHGLFNDAKEADAFGVPMDETKRRKDAAMGTQVAFSSQEFKFAMTRGACVYRCAGNAFGLAPFFSLAGSVKKGVENPTETSFAEPDSYVGTMVLLFGSGTMVPMPQKGALQRPSPEDVWLAKSLRLAQTIKDGADDATLVKKKAAMLEASWQFDVYENGWATPTDAALPRAISLQEQTVAEGIAVGRDVGQRIFEVQHVWEALEAQQGGARASNESTAEDSRHRIALHSWAENVTTVLVEPASCIYAGILKEPGIVRERFVQERPSAKLRLAANKTCKQNTYIEFALHAIDDLTTRGHLAPGEVSERSLNDGTGPSKELIDMLNLEHDLRSYLLQFDLEARVRGAQSKSAARNALASFANNGHFCAQLQGLPEMAWMSEMPSTTKAIVDVYEVVIDVSDYDPAIRAAAWMSMALPALLKQRSSAGAFAAVEALVEKEHLEAWLANKGSQEPNAAETAGVDKVASPGDAGSGADEARTVIEEAGEADWQKLAMLKIIQSVNFVIDPGKSEANDDLSDSDELAKVEDAPKFSAIAVVVAGRGNCSRVGTEVEIVLWLQLPATFVREVISSCFAKQVVDFAPGNCASAALDQGTGVASTKNIATACWPASPTKSSLARATGSTMYNAAYAIWCDAQTGGQGSTKTTTPNARGNAKTRPGGPTPRGKKFG